MRFDEDGKGKGLSGRFEAHERWANGEAGRLQRR
jgi:hypothetical protein